MEEHPLLSGIASNEHFYCTTNCEHTCITDVNVTQKCLVYPVVRSQYIQK